MQIEIFLLGVTKIMDFTAVPQRDKIEVIFSFQYFRFSTKLCQEVIDGIKMSTLTDNGNKSMVHCLGIKAIQSINTYTADKLKKYEEDFLWLQEILTECKRTFAK